MIRYAAPITQTKPFEQNKLPGINLNTSFPGKRESREKPFRSPMIIKQGKIRYWEHYFQLIWLNKEPNKIPTVEERNVVRPYPNMCKSFSTK